MQVQLSLASALVRDAFTAHMQQQQHQQQQQQQQQQNGGRHLQAQMPPWPGRSAPQQVNTRSSSSSSKMYGSRPTPASAPAKQTQQISASEYGKNARHSVPNMQQSFSSQHRPTWGQVCAVRRGCGVALFTRALLLTWAWVSDVFVIRHKQAKNLSGGLFLMLILLWRDLQTSSEQAMSALHFAQPQPQQRWDSYYPQQTQQTSNYPGMRRICVCIHMAKFLAQLRSHEGGRHPMHF